MKHDKQPVKANQFIYKAILINTMFALQQPMDQQSIITIMQTLQDIYSTQIAYSEGDRSHPFLEEVIALLSSVFESSGQIRNAIYMWHNLLNIQQKLFDGERPEMLTAYKKVATLYLHSGSIE